MRKYYLLVFVMALASTLFKAHAEGDPVYCVPEGNFNVLSIANGLKDVGFLSGDKVRYIETITVSGANHNGASAGDFTVNVNTGPDREPVVYYDRTDNVLNVTPGDELTIKWKKTTNSTWMHYYAFIDYDQDGVFKDLAKPANSEVVAWTYYQGKNSKGATVNEETDFFEMPNFTIPENAKLGKTRIRFKVDWDSKNPCQNEVANNQLHKNAGTIVDFTINIVEAPASHYNIKYNTPTSGGGVMVFKLDNTPITSDSNLDAGTEVKVLVSPVAGHEIETFTINGEDALDLLVEGPMGYIALVEMTENRDIKVEFAKKTFAVTFNSPLAELGALTLQDVTKNVALTTGALVEYGSSILVTAETANGSTLKSLKINNVERMQDLVSNQLTIGNLKATLDVQVEFVASVEPEGPVYCVPEGEHNTVATKWLTGGSARYIKTVTVTGANFNGASVGDFTVNVNAGPDREPTVYYDRIDNVLNATPGDELAFAWTKSDNMTWMHYYIYIDYDNDGEFNETTEAVSWTYYNSNQDAVTGTNSKEVKVGNGDDFFKAPSFVIPEAVKLGKTRVRFKVDWSCMNPCENTNPGNYLYKNAGVIVDFTINIAPVKKPVLTIEQPDGGTLAFTKEDGSAVNSGDEIDSGSKLTIVATPEDGKHLKCLLIDGEVVYDIAKVTVTEDMTISGVFTSDWYIKHNAVENGKIIITNNGAVVANGADLASGTEVNVTILPNTGYEIKTLTINGEDASGLFVSENAYTSTLTMTENKVIKVELAKKKFAVTFNTPLAEVGTFTVRNVTGATNLATGALVEYGSEILITTKASAIATLKSLKINNVERMQDLVSDKLTVELTNALNIKVEFFVTEYTLTWSVVGDGTVKVFNTNKDEEEVMNGDQVVKSHYLYLKITPEEGYEVSSIKMNNEEMDLTEDNYDLQIEEGHWIYWFEMTEDITFEVTFIDPVGLTNTQDDLLISYDVQSATLILAEDVKAAIIDLSGKLVRNITESSTSLSELPNGIYFVKAATMTQQRTIKIVKK